MIAIATTETLSTSNPKLTFFGVDGGFLVDPVSLEWAVYSKVNDTQKAEPVSVATGTTNLTTDKIGTGRFALAHTFAGLTAGLHEVRWTYELPSGKTGVAIVDFDVVAFATGFRGPAYALVSEMREEGVPASVADARIFSAITMASRMVEEATGRFFEARYLSQKYDGTGKRMLLLKNPIVAVERLMMDTYLGEDATDEVDVTAYRIFNRHLSEGMTDPDDRENPKIEFLNFGDLLGYRVNTPLSGIRISENGFPRGVQNVLIDGVFGYTENHHNGVPWGNTPDLIRLAARLLTLRYIPGLRSDCRADAKASWRITQEKVMDQSISYSQEANWGRITGDAEIDQILAMYAKPQDLGSA